MTSAEQLTAGRVVTIWPRVLWVAGTILLLTMLVHIAALVITGGTWNGPVSLRKPATFAETGWLAAWSVALILPRLRMPAWQQHIVGAGTLLFGVVETAVMAAQAWRGVPSHYNFTTPLDVALMRGGAAGTAGIFLIGVVVLLVAALRSRGVSRSVRLGVSAGIAVLLLGCVLGLVMVFNNSGVYQGSVGAEFTGATGAYLGPDPATVGPQYLLLRPATDGGDLVLLHAMGVHGLVLLAVPAVLLARTAMSADRQLWRTGLAVTSVTAAIAVLLVHALRQLPLVELPPLAFALLAVCAAALITTWISTGVALLDHADRDRKPSDA